MWRVGWRRVELVMHRQHTHASLAPVCWASGHLVGSSELIDSVTANANLYDRLRKYSVNPGHLPWPKSQPSPKVTSLAGFPGRVCLVEFFPCQITGAHAMQRKVGET